MVAWRLCVRYTYKNGTERSTRLGEEKFHGGGQVMRLLILTMLVAAAVARADDVARHFDIPAQDMQSALSEFARQSDRQILFSTDVAASKRSVAVKGELEPEAALKRLLKGTGLTFRVTADRAILVEKHKTTVRAIRNDLRVQNDTLPAGTHAERLEEIFVTATRREQNLREVPQSVTALTQRSLERIQADDFEDYAKLVPGLQVTTPTPGNSQVILRGLSSLNSASTTGIYVDSTPYGSSSGLANGNHLTADLNTFDLQRVEVLRGPQGTLYGASTMGGLLKFVTHPPDLSRFASRVQLNTEDVKGEMGLSAKGLINVPLSERLAVRLTGVRNEEPGFIDDPLRDLDDENDTTSNAVRGSLLFQAADDLRIRLTSMGQDNELAGANDVDLAVDRSDPVLTPLQPYRPLHADLSHAREFSERTHTRYRVHNATVNWSLPGVDVMSSTSYGTFRQEAMGDVSLLEGLIQKNGAALDKLTQEVQLTSQSEHSTEWVAGVYYTSEKAALDQRYTHFVYDGSAVALDSEFEELALFGTLTCKFTPNFDVAFGLRAARNEQQAFQHGEGVFVDFLSREDSTEEVLLYSIAPRWRPSDATTIYMRVASGYRPGGPNIIPLGNPDNAPRSYGSDSVLSVEAGVKTDLLERSVSMDLSAFFLSWKDLQLSGVVNDTSVMSNAGEAQSRGIEWAVELGPFQGFTVDLIGAYIDAALTESTATGTDVDLLNGRAGDPLPYVSKWTALIGVNYEWPLSGTATAYAGANWNYIGERRTDFGSKYGRQLTLPGYDTTYVRFGIDFERWSIGFYGKNITDTRGVSSFSESNSRQGGGVYDPDAFTWAFGSTFLVIRPRTFGLTLSARF
jgi:iron complex outermembrane receptor protein